MPNFDFDSWAQMLTCMAECDVTLRVQPNMMAETLGSIFVTLELQGTGESQTLALQHGLPDWTYFRLIGEAVKQLHAADNPSIFSPRSAH